MENEELDEPSDSSQILSSERNLGKSRPKPKPNSKVGLAKVGGNSVEPKLNLSDILLTQLQSLCADLLKAGINVSLHEKENQLAILLPLVKTCQVHKMIHSGQICPMCLCNPIGGVQ